MSALTPAPIEAHEVRPLTASQIAMPFRGRWVREVFVNRLGLPRRHVYAALRTVKASMHPRQVWLRRRIGRQLAAQEPGLAEWRERGYRIFGPGELPGLETAVSICRSAFEKPRAAGADTQRGKKRFLLSPVAGQQFCAHPDLVRFMVSEPLLRSASAYLGFVPVLAGAALWWSPAGSKPPWVRSQRYHSDHEDTTQLKLLVYIEDVGDDQGPFTILSPRVSDRIRDEFGTRRGRIDDDKVASVEGGEAPDVLTGPAGTAVLVDPSRCLHYGSRTSRTDRVALMVQFLRFNSPAESRLALRPEGELAREPWSPLQRLVLGLRD